MLCFIKVSVNTGIGISHVNISRYILSGAVVVYNHISVPLTLTPPHIPPAVVCAMECRDEQELQIKALARSVYSQSHPDDKASIIFNMYPPNRPCPSSIHGQWF